MSRRDQRGGRGEARVPSGCEPAPRPARRRWGIIASAARGMEGGRRELGPGPPPTPPPFIRPASPATATAIHIPQSRSAPGARRPGAPRVRGRSAGGTALLWGQVTRSGRRGPGASSLSHGQVSEPLPAAPSVVSKVFIYPPLLCARPCTRLVKQPSPCPPQASLTNPESEEGGADKETLKRGSKLTLGGRRPFV